MFKKNKDSKRKMNIGNSKVATLYKDNKDIVNRILFTLLVLFIFRLGALITVPGVTIVPGMGAASGGQFFSMISMLGGGALDKFSIFALGVSPYITASIIVQLLSSDVIPPLARWAKDGKNGKKKLDSLTKALTIPFGIAQAFATLFALNGKVINIKWMVSGSAQFNSGTPLFYYTMVPLLLLAGTMITLWMAEQITSKGVGNGISLLIFAGIATNLPSSIQSVYDVWVSTGTSADMFDGLLKFGMYILSFLLIILLVVLFSISERKIPIQQSGSGMSTKESGVSHLPLKINSAGVLPVIFASALLTAPMTISEMIKGSNPDGTGFTNFVDDYLAFKTWSGIAIFATLVILFTFLYSQIQINPEKIAEDFKKNGTYIPGIRPGMETQKYLTGVINRLSCLGATFLAFIAVLPFIIQILAQDIPPAAALGGTGLIIMVGVAIETIKQVKGRTTQQAYVDVSDGKSSAKNKYMW